ncbi:SSI family serine proteinase inhibitor [Streptomyces sp. cmx-18-6]|uniref:SSI family serine proteinase inhibitor n=1 Tax=Streptomyces sp. cmx-18-6 TaxID=2790930 RepID=UPI00397FDFEF
MLRRLALTAVVSLASLAALSTAVPAATASGPTPSALPTSGPLSAAVPALGPLPVPVPALPSFLGGGSQDDGGDGNGDGGVNGPAVERTRLTVTVERSGVAGADGTFELTCEPTGGTHPQRQAACDRLAEAGATRAGRQLFRATPEGSMCTMIYGGDASARIVGTWDGRPVDTTVTRGDGCEIARWNSLVPVLPDLR